MKSSAFYAVLGIGVLLVVGIVWWGVSSRMKPVQGPTNSQATTTAPLTEGMSIYANGEYGFTVFYPGSDTATSSFEMFYHLPDTWRVGALPNATGTPLMAFIDSRIQNDNSYPRYFDAEVRVGVSKDQKEVAACTKVGDGELPQTDVQLGGTTWKAFGFQDAGMMQYSKGISYRTVHNGYCFALEKIETGSSYRDDPANPKDIPDSELDAKYAALGPIVQSFSFINP